MPTATSTCARRASGCGWVGVLERALEAAEAGAGDGLGYTSNYKLAVDAAQALLRATDDGDKERRDESSDAHLSMLRPSVGSFFFLPFFFLPTMSERSSSSSSIKSSSSSSSSSSSISASDSLLTAAFDFLAGGAAAAAAEEEEEEAFVEDFAFETPNTISLGVNLLPEVEEAGGIATEDEVTTGFVLTSFARGIRSSSSSSSITIVVVAFFAVCPEEVEVFEADAAVSLGCGENLRAEFIGFGEKEAAVGGADTAGV